MCFSGRRRAGGRVLGVLAGASGGQRALTGASGRWQAPMDANWRQRAGQRGHAPASAGSRPSALPTEREKHTHLSDKEKKNTPGDLFDQRKLFLNSTIGIWGGNLFLLLSVSFYLTSWFF